MIGFIIKKTKQNLWKQIFVLCLS